MEPLSALSIAACVVQFVDFGSRLLTEGRQIYTDGRSDANVDFSTVATDFSNLSREVEAKSELLGPAPAGSSQEVFLRLCRECQQIAAELEDALSTVQTKQRSGRGDAIRSVLAVIQTIWPDERIRSMKTRLEEMKGHMMIAALVNMWTESNKNGDRAAEFASQQAQIIERLERQDERTREFSRLITDAMDNRDTNQGLETKRMLFRMPWNSKLLPNHPLTNFTLPNTADHLHRSMSVDSAISNSLLFESIGDREETIPQAHAVTFSWVFREPRTGPDKEPLWSDFPLWLEGPSDDIYWITGKPGAGKSTLMKYIASNPELKSHLKTWSGGLPVIVAGFHSWNAGTSMQRSHEGLFRTLLYQIFNQDPSLIREMCPHRWALLYLFGPTESLSLPDWTLVELNDCLFRLAARAGKSFCLMLLIDGLDEFQDDLRELINVINEINAHDGVKICTSSRPWNVFEDAYRLGPKLRLEDLTKDDISRYIRAEFDKSEAFRELMEGSPDQGNNLLNSIAVKAQGVFLWVSIVVQALLYNIAEGDRLSQLQTTLDSLPDDLSQLFQRIWDRVDPKYRIEASHYFQFIESMHKYDQPVYLQTLWLADEDTPWDFTLGNVTHDVAIGATKITKRRLNGRTRGLVEANKGGRVDYLHRTTRDWILQNWNTVVATSDPRFDCNLSLLKALTIQIGAIAAGVKKPKPTFQPGDVWGAASISFGTAAAITSESDLVCTVIDRLETEINTLFHRNWNQNTDDDYDQETGFITKQKNVSNSKHWTVIIEGQYLRDLRAYENPNINPAKQRLLELCAQIPVVSYVRAKLVEHPEKPTPGVTTFNTVLRNAVFGFEFRNKTDKTNYATHNLESMGLGAPIFGPQRLELVRYIMETCAGAFSLEFLSDIYSDISRWDWEGDFGVDLREYRTQVKEICLENIRRVQSNPIPDITTPGPGANTDKQQGSGTGQIDTGEGCSKRNESIGANDRRSRRRGCQGFLCF